jgi:MFS transporter, ACS family, glucarate transporter
MPNPYQSPRIQSDDATAPPSRTRIGVLAFLCALAGILYLDRICLGTAAEDIQKEFTTSTFEFTNTHISYVHMAFTLAYGLFELPVGRWGDRMGARKVLTRITLCWSLFTALTGAATGLYSLIAVRFLFGAGEAGAYPNAARVLARWFPDQERGRAQGMLITCGQLGGALAPLVTSPLIKSIGWRWSFALFGLAGVFWGVAFWWWYRDDPEEHPGVNARELALIRTGAAALPKAHGAVPWNLVVRNPSIWILAGIIICSSFNSYFYFSWLNKYLVSARGVEKVWAGVLTSVVLGGSAMGTITGGWVADRILRTSPDADRTRRYLGSTCFALAALFLGLSVLSDSAEASCLMAAISCLCAFLMLPTWWSCATKISGKHTGAMFGLMNMLGVGGALCSQYFVGAYADWRKAEGYTGRSAWDGAFLVFIVVLLLAAFGWRCYRSVPVEKNSSLTP